MRTKNFEDLFGNIHSRFIIEEITITKKSDIAKSRKLTDMNQHNEVRLMACKYTHDTIFERVVKTIEDLNELSGSGNISEEQIIEHQALTKFISDHYDINF